MDYIYSARFNGSTLELHKYAVKSDTGDILMLENVREAGVPLATHVPARTVRAVLGKIQEVYNAYVVYVKDTDELANAAALIKGQIEQDKTNYMLAVQERIDQFDMQLAATEIDLDEAIKELM